MARRSRRACGCGSGDGTDYSEAAPERKRADALRSSPPAGSRRGYDDRLSQESCSSRMPVRANG